MAEFTWHGTMFRGTRRGALGVFTSQHGNCTFAGGIDEAGKPDGHGVFKWSDIEPVCQSSAYTTSAQFAAGAHHGYAELQYDDGEVRYFLYAHGRDVHHGRGSAAGCEYDGQRYAADHAGFVALKAAAQQAGHDHPGGVLHSAAPATAEVTHRRAHHQHPHPVPPRRAPAWQPRSVPPPVPIPL